MTPQPEAFITIASTSPRSTYGHHASMLARICARPPSWSFRWNFTAPQQPASGATRVWMPAASSTRAVAVFTLGIIDGCTQPASISTLRACVRVGQAPASCLGGTFSRSRAGSIPRTVWPSFIAGPKRGEVRPCFSVQRSAASPALRPTLRSTMPRPMSTRFP